jgi:hypothetical protein
MPTPGFRRAFAVGILTGFIQPDVEVHLVRSVAVSSRARVRRPAFDQRLDHLGQDAPGDAIGPLAGGDGGVAGAELVAELRGPDPGGDGPPAPGQHDSE